MDINNHSFYLYIKNIYLGKTIDEKEILVRYQKKERFYQWRITTGRKNNRYRFAHVQGSVSNTQFQRANTNVEAGKI
jgi:hypothetical protein